MHLLLVEDDERLARLIIRMLKRERYTIDWVSDGVSAYDYARLSHYDVIILDWMLPKMSGVDVCRRLREDNYQGAILLLTARTGVEERVTGLDSGADDYLEKPFEFKELFARLRALERRRYFPYEDETIRVLDLVIHTREHAVYRGSEKIDLTPREYQLFTLLARNKNHVLTREVILERVWGADHEVTNNTLDAFIKLLRKKLDPSGKRKYIKTVRGVGYRLDDDA